MLVRRLQQALPESPVELVSQDRMLKQGLEDDPMERRVAKELAETCILI